MLLSVFLLDRVSPCGGDWENPLTTQKIVGLVKNNMAFKVMGL